MKNILISATIPQRFQDQIIFAKDLVNQTSEFMIYFFISDDVYSLYSDVVDELDYKIINKPKKVNIIRAHSGLKNIIKDKIKSYLSIDQLNILRKYIDYFNNSFLFTNTFKKKEREFSNYLRNNYQNISRLIDKHNIDAILLNGDRHLGLEPVFLKISKDLNIPSIIIYLAYYADEELIFFNNYATQKIKPNLLTSKYIVNSQKTLTYKTARNSYYYPHYIANSLKNFGVLTKNPYVMGSGGSDILCINNHYNKELHICNGVDEKKIRIVGDGNYDTLYKQYSQRQVIRQNIFKKYHLDNNKKIIIIGLPQLGEHGELPWDRHWQEINFLVKSLHSLNQNILISLHPKMNKDDYKFLEKKFNCKILNERLIHSLPSADLYIATYSSTVTWSVLCGINTVVIDFYGFKCSMYDFLNSIRIVEQKDNLKSTLQNSLTEKVDFSKDWEKLSKNMVFDGRTMKRYITLIRDNLFSK